MWCWWWKGWRRWWWSPWRRAKFQQTGATGAISDLQPDHKTKEAKAAARFSLQYWRRLQQTCKNSETGSEHIKGKPSWNHSKTLPLERSSGHFPVKLLSSLQGHYSLTLWSCLPEDRANGGSQRQKMIPLCCRRLLSTASPPFSSFSCLLTQHTLLFGVTMNHGNWLCCHISNTPAQGLTAWCVTAGRSSLLKGCTAGWPNSASLVQGHTSSYHSKWSRITHVCRKNEDVLLKIPAIVPIRTVFTTAPSVFKLC